MKFNEQDDQLRLEQSKSHLENLLVAEQTQTWKLRIETQLEIGYDPKELYDYIKDNWLDKHIIELTRLLLDWSHSDMV